MTKQVREEIETLLKDFGTSGERGIRRSGEQEQNRAIGSSGQRVIEMQRPSTQYSVPSTQKQGRPWSRAQRRAWREMMEDAGCRLPFPEDREAIREVLAHTLRRMVGCKMMPRDAEAIVHLCKLMLRI